MSGRRAITLVARREIRERLRSKVFLVSTLVLLLVVGGSTGLQGALSKKPTYHVVVMAPAPAGLLPALERAAKPFDDTKVQLRVVASPAAGRKALETEQADALLLLSQNRLVFRTDVDPKAEAIADTAVRALRNHLPPAPEQHTTTMIEGIQKAVTVPVMAKCRIGHFAEAQILQELGVDYIDESEVLTPADEAHHVDKHAFKVPFVCGARNLGEALRRIAEGAAMIRTKGEAGTGDVVHAVKHMRQIVQEMKILTVLSQEELYAKAKEHQAPYELVRMVAKAGKLPVPNFSAGGIATPADASLVMQLGAEAVFVGSGIFMKNSTEFADPEEAGKRARAIVRATTHYQDPKVLLEVSEDLAAAMKGLAVAALDEAHLLQTRGW